MARSALKLFRIAVDGGDEEGERASKALRELYLRNSQEVFDLAAEFCRSEVAYERKRALDLLGLLGVDKPRSERPYFEECVDIAIHHLLDEDVRVVRSAAWALDHLGDESCVLALIDLREHNDAKVRQAVAVGVGNSCSERWEATETLLDLMNDIDEEVRNHATALLGIQPDKDSLRIREAFRERLRDTLGEVRDEALWALARREDIQGLRMLLSRLESDQWDEGDAGTAADILADRMPDTGNLCSGLRMLLRSQA